MPPGAPGLLGKADTEAEPSQRQHLLPWVSGSGIQGQPRRLGAWPPSCPELGQDWWVPGTRWGHAQWDHCAHLRLGTAVCVAEVPAPSAPRQGRPGRWARAAPRLCQASSPTGRGHCPPSLPRPWPRPWLLLWGHLGSPEDIHETPASSTELPRSRTRTGTRVPVQTRSEPTHHHRPGCPALP